jgi:hypothetical protein
MHDAASYLSLRRYRSAPWHIGGENWSGQQRIGFRWQSASADDLEPTDSANHIQWCKLTRINYDRVVLFHKAGTLGYLYRQRAKAGAERSTSTHFTPALHMFHGTIFATEKNEENPTVPIVLVATP